MIDHSGWARMYTIGADHVPLPCFGIVEWGRWMQDNHGAAFSRVGDDMTDEYRVSTVFLGLDHNHGAHGDPVLFETMVFFPDGESGDMDRYCTWAAAAAGHERICSMLAHETAAAHALSLATLRALLSMPARASTSRNAREGYYDFKTGGHHRRRRDLVGQGNAP